MVSNTLSSKGLWTAAVLVTAVATLGFIWKQHQQQQHKDSENHDTTTGRKISKTSNKYKSAPTAEIQNRKELEAERRIPKRDFSSIKKITIQQPQQLMQTTTSLPPQPLYASTTSLPLPVDRDWMKKLLKESNSNINSNSNSSNGSSRALVVAPMVDQSDYAFRILARRYGANVTYTPMIHASLLTRSEAYRLKFVPRHRCAIDRPVIAQLCGDDPLVLEQAAKMVAPYVDAIDLNCGCPQGIAKRGNYGAFLLEQEELLLKCVRHLVQTISLPVTVKVRLLPDDDDQLSKSMALYQKLVDAGIHLLTVHGRDRHQLHVHTGSADWSAIQKVVERFGHRIPIFANGNIGSMADVRACFEATGADGVMSSEAVLEYPALFAGDDVRLGRIRLAREYLQLARQYPPQEGHQGSGIKCLKGHVHRFLHPDLEAPTGTKNYELRQGAANATSWQVLWDIVDHVEQKQQAEQHKVEEEQLSWYMRHRITVVDNQGNFISSSELKTMRDKGLIATNVAKQNNDLEDSDQVAAYTFFNTKDGGDDEGDY